MKYQDQRITQRSQYYDHLLVLLSHYITKCHDWRQYQKILTAIYQHFYLTFIAFCLYKLLGVLANSSLCSQFTLADKFIGIEDDPSIVCYTSKRTLSDQYYLLPVNNLINLLLLVLFAVYLPALVTGMNASMHFISSLKVHSYYRNFKRLSTVPNCKPNPSVIHNSVQISIHLHCGVFATKFNESVEKLSGSRI
uniref:Innexin n=1 Tax=Glossina palpalis gambiensis TaxID=67801 RepID=A0A1B0BIK0_9MUSC